MGRNLSSKLMYNMSGGDYSDWFSLPAASTINVDIDLTDAVNAQCLIEVTYSATHASTTGVTTTVFYGFGPQDSTAVGPVPCKKGTAGSTTTATAGTSVAVFSDNSDAVSMVTMTTGQSSAITKRTYFYFNDPLLKNPRWQRLQFTNTDVTNAASIRVFMDT